MYVLDTDAQGVSTTWRSKVDTIRPPAQGHGTAARRASILRRSTKRAAREAITVTLQYRGGEEAWIRIGVRGGVVRLPGHTSLYDALMRCHEGPIYHLGLLEH